MPPQSQYTMVGIMDSGNNKHHNFKSHMYCPYGVKYVSVKITGVHGPEVVRVGIGTAYFSVTYKGSNDRFIFREPNSIINIKSPVNLLCMNKFHYKQGRYGSNTGHKVDFLDEVINLKNGQSLSMPHDKESQLPLLEIYPIQRKRK